MPKLNNIISFINTGIGSALTTERFQGGVFYNELVELVPEINKDSRSTKPGIVAYDGDITEVILDDTLPFQIYHRLTGLDYVSVPAENSGDPGEFIQEAANMVMVVISDRNRIQMQPNDFLAVVTANIPQEMPSSTAAALGIESVLIEIESASSDMEANYNAEYNVENYGLKPNSIFYSVQYKITSIFGKECFPAC